MQTKTFFIKPGYISRQCAQYFIDELGESQGVLHQPDVYPFAAEILRRSGGRTILDLGCGRARKLSALHPEFDLIGVDFGANLEWCKAQYHFGHWVQHDFERAPFFPPSHWDLDGAGVICSDVIEHLLDPEPLLETVTTLLERVGFALFSTPERDLVRGQQDAGPPANPHHIREWNLAEFRELMESSGLSIWASGLTCNNDRDWQKRTALVLTRNKGWKTPPPPDSFRVTAVICAYNEADIIEHTLNYLTEQGIRVILIDNWSTDGTYEKAQAFVQKGLTRIERFPNAGPTGTYDWHNLLCRVEQIALELDTDWVIHHDADEIRESPWKEMTLRHALYQVDQEGYNCVNHICLVFPPTEDSELKAGLLPTAFRHFEFGKRPAHFAQYKAWKKQGVRVNLSDSGGHDVLFPDRRVYPLRFLLKHYPIRSHEHGLKKVFKDRLNRYNPHDRQVRGWHTQYDRFRDCPSFLRDPQDLLLYTPDRFHDEYMTERLTGIGILR